MSDTTLTAQFVAFLNSDLFLREFSFSQTKFTPSGRSEVEVGDHLVRIGNLVFLYQVKERDSTGQAPIEVWLNSKVLKKATKQIRDTVQVLGAGHPVTIANERGHSFDLSSKADDRSFRLVLFRSGEGRTPLPYPRFHDSRTVGFIHIFDVLDYFGVCRYLITPVEIADYLTWREQVFHSRPVAGSISEASLVGQYLVDALDEEPGERFSGVLVALLHDQEKFDLSYLFASLGDHVVYATAGERETSYYPILRILAQLNRSELRTFKERFDESLRAVRENQFIRPLRFVASSLDCGFVLVPLTADHFEKRLTALNILSIAAKYELKMTHQVGISFAATGADLMIDWLYASWPWAQDAAMDSLLRDRSPFRPMRRRKVPRYLFATERLRSAGLLAEDGTGHGTGDQDRREAGSDDA